LFDHLWLAINSTEIQGVLQLQSAVFQSSLGDEKKRAGVSVHLSTDAQQTHLAYNNIFICTDGISARTLGKLGV